MAEGLEPLHVDGRYLKNSRGDIVTLHGYMAVLDPWFQAEEYTWEGFDVATCLKNKKAAIDRLLASDWKIDYVRFGLDAYWFSDDIINQSGTIDFERFKKYFEELFLPLIEYYHEKGIYTLLWLQQGTPPTIEVGDKNQELNLLMWNYISSHPRIRNNPGVMFELANEPVYINCRQGDNDYFQYLSIAKNSSVFKEARDYWQPIVDMIRSKCDNIIYISGFRWQTLYSGYTDYPIIGNNIGYAVHSYPRTDVREHWENEVFPISYMAPIIITECAWGYGDDDVINNWAQTSNFGAPLKSVVDEIGNVSWNCFEPREDYYYLVNQSSQSDKAKVSNDPEVCFLPMFQWWNEYSKTKIIPTSQLKAKKVSFDFFPTVLAPGEKALAKIMAEFTNGMTWNVAGDAEYSIADESVLSITHGVFKGMKEGTTVVTVKYTDGTGQTFSREFEVTNTLFPLTKEGFVLDLFALDAKGSFDENTGTFRSEGCGSGGWSYVGGQDFSFYKYLIVQLNHEQQSWATLHITDDINESDENQAWNDDIGGIGFPFNDATEMVINLQTLHKQNGEPLDLTHICHLDIWMNGELGAVSIKRVFLSNDGVTPVCYQIPTRVYADNKVMYQGDEVPALTFSTSLPAINGVPKLSTTASSSSRVGTYPITIERGTVTNQDATFVNGYLFVMERPKFDIQGDVTYFYLFNPSFDRNLSGWTNTNGTARWKENTWDVLSNYCEFEWTGEPIANQEVVQFPILPAGDYRLSVDCVSDANSKGLYLVAGSNTKELVGKGGINSFSFDFNVAEESQIKIGFKVENTTATWVNFDNFKLEKISSTAINSIKSDESHHAIIYNLSGQRLSKPQKGINIIDGKKVVVK